MKAIPPPIPQSEWWNGSELANCCFCGHPMRCRYVVPPALVGLVGNEVPVWLCFICYTDERARWFGEPVLEGGVS